MSRRFLACVVTFLALVIVAPQLPAAGKSSVALIVPYAEGGPGDALAGALARALARALHVDVAVENVAGAGGTVGAARVARARADGRTLLLADNALATAGALYRRLPFDVLTDFSPIGMVDAMPLVLAARPGLPARETGSLAALSRSRSHRLSIADAGSGAPSQLCALLLVDATRGELATVSYRETSQAFTDLIGGQVDLVCDTASQVLPHIRGGKVRPVGVTTTRRHALLPQVPTLAEIGFSAADFAYWHMVLAPAGTPVDAVDKLVRALQTALRDASFAQRLETAGSAVAAPGQATPAAARNMLVREISRWSPLIHKVGLVAD